MPLRCIDEDKDIFSFEITNDEEWETLRKTNGTKKNLKMACCDSGVVLKISKLGTRYFSHTRRGECSTAPETPEHLLAKMKVIEGIKETDWEPYPEESGKTSDGCLWRADVLAKKNAARIAFEIQWTRQQNDQTESRQKRYAESRVRGLWLFRQSDFPASKEIPSFKLEYDTELKSFAVLIPSHYYDPSSVSTRSVAAHYWQQKIPLVEFVAGALEGRLRYAPLLNVQIPVEIHTVNIDCWKCHRETSVVIDVVFAASKILPGHSDIFTTIYEMSEDIQNGAEAVMNLLPSNLLKSYGIGAVKPRYSKTMGGKYLSNGCLHCDALQGRFFEHEFAHEATIAFETVGVIRNEWAAEINNFSKNLNYWWFIDAKKNPTI